MKEEGQKNQKKAWKNSRRRRGNNWPKKGGRGNQFDHDEENYRPVKKDNKNNRVDWQALLMEEEYDIDNG